MVNLCSNMWAFLFCEWFVYWIVLEWLKNQSRKSTQNRYRNICSCILLLDDNFCSMRQIFMLWIFLIFEGKSNTSSKGNGSNRQLDQTAMPMEWTYVANITKNDDHWMFSICWTCQQFLENAILLALVVSILIL